MAHIAIYVSSQAVGLSGGFRLVGQALVSPDAAAVPWETPDIPWTATSVQVNQAVQDAAIAAVTGVGYTVGELENKIVIGGAAGVM